MLISTKSQTSQSEVYNIYIKLKIYNKICKLSNLHKRTGDNVAKQNDKIMQNSTLTLYDYEHFCSVFYLNAVKWLELV